MEKEHCCCCMEAVSEKTVVVDVAKKDDEEKKKKIMTEQSEQPLVRQCLVVTSLCAYLCLLLECHMTVACSHHPC